MNEKDTGNRGEFGAGPPGGKKRDNWRLAKYLAIALAVVAAVWFGGREVYIRYMDYRVLTTDIDALPQDGQMMRYAAWRAKPVFVRNCESCHGTEMEGNPVIGVPNLTDHEWLYGTGEPSDIETTITYGIRSGNPRSRNLAIMPSFTHPNDPLEKINPLTPPEIRAIVNFLFYLEGRKPPDPKLVDAGRTLFEGHAYCYDCHTQDARGDQDIGAPNLRDNIWLYGHGTFASIFRSIEFGHQGVCPAWIHRLSPATIRELALYIYSKSHKTVVTSRGRQTSAS